MPFTKCPQCGYSELPEIKSHHAVMNHYVNTETKEVCVINRNEEKFVGKVGKGDSAKEVQFIRQDIFEKENRKTQQAEEQRLADTLAKEKQAEIEKQKQIKI